MRKLGKGCLVVFGTIVVLAILGALLGRGGASNSATAQPTAAITGRAETGAPTVAPTEPLKAFGIGDNVTVDQMRWKILAAEDLGTTLTSDNQFIKDLTTSGRFVRVRFEMENLSKDLLSYAGIDLVDGQGRSFKGSSDAVQFIPQEEVCIFENLNPNIIKTCTAIFEVPANAAGLHAQVTDLKLLGAKAELVDLGLTLP